MGQRCIPCCSRLMYNNYASRQHLTFLVCILLKKINISNKTNVFRVAVYERTQIMNREVAVAYFKASYHNLAGGTVERIRTQDLRCTMQHIPLRTTQLGCRFTLRHWVGADTVVKKHIPIPQPGVEPRPLT